ncbi:23S rRNA (uracil(1939)-C(5))-methyltransferase RlmD [Evansella cellulosilytica]|uniref:RNA methyltransferase, TrmA family n=1 Tax=Evansella cellulosilytica (strain ATCC 21833 / DSM 2522 / FERM P-1141 / JCM 9156 / N-4) TaxID=649639 RepID=E6U0P6_EVAC2|nr:23S rRNA (uracil(1939)-C(5))-methyltransferase RlmD [Evansella cellulosilytica]ADU29094.1 RNA methyltransferase, TrmA family [Evansella cellulosilytica DSM 2522]
MKQRKGTSKQQSSQLQIKEGQRFPLTIKRMGIDGEGVGFFKRQVVFVPGALPGEEIVCEVAKIKGKFAEGRIVKIRKPSDDRIAPPCPIYKECGGCQLQHLSYEGQLKGKKDIVRQAFERYTKINLDKVDFHDTIGMEEPWKYRNKSQMQVGHHQGKVIAGLYSPNSHKLIDLEDCIVQHPQTNKVTNVVKQLAADMNIAPYNERKRTGVLRTIVTRVGFETGEYQVVLVTAKKDIPKVDLFIEAIKQRLPDVTSIVQNINPKKTSLVFGDETIVLYGKEKIEETMSEFRFNLSPRAFFQLNPIQTKKLYDAAKEAAQLTGKEKVVDAYCGVGTIGLWLAAGAKEIRGMDVIKESIEDAKNNAKAHGIKNAHYVSGKAEHLLPEWEKEGWHPDVVVVDPPRTGLDETFIQTLLRVKPKRIVYVSCNPSTLAKNVDALSKGGYKLKALQPVDMFPQTAQVECVARIELKH